MNYCTFAILALCLVFVNTSTAQSLTGELKRWHKVTLVVDGPSSSETATPNPFADYRMQVTFIHPGSGLSYVVPGYFAADGDAANSSATSGNKWHAHLSPDEIGLWEYAVSFREGPDVAIDPAPGAGTAVAPYDGLTGTFTIQETDKSGADFRAKGRLEYVGEHYLRFAGSGKYFVKAGPDSPENMLAYEDFDDTPNDPNKNGNLRKSWSPHAADYAAADASAYTWTDAVSSEVHGTELLGGLRYLSDIEGLNSISFLTFSLDGDDDNVFPHLLLNGVTAFEDIGDSGGELPTEGRWADTTDGVHHDRFDVSKMAQWERIMAYATKKGLFMDIKTQETENDRKLDGGDLGRERKLYYRELIARFSHNLGLQWNLGEENDIYNELNDSNQTRVKSYAEYFNDNDPYNHLVTIHSYPGGKGSTYNPLLGNNSQLTGASLQTNNSSFNNVFGDVRDWVENSANAGKPWVVYCDEPGDAQAALRPDSDPGASHENGRKNALWGSIMAGGAGANFYFGYRYSNSDLTLQDWRSRDNFWDYCRHMLQFFEAHDIPLEDMSNDNSITSNADSWGLAKTGDTYLIYLKNGGSTSIDLSGFTGTYSVHWYDPRNGGPLQQTAISEVTGGGNRALGSAPNNTDQDWLIVVRFSDGTPFVASFTLINASTDQPVPGFDPIPDNATISTFELGITNFNVRANTLPDLDFGSVVFSLSGATEQNQSEDQAPWALFGDSAGDFDDASFNLGSHTLTATPYDEDGGTGNAGNPLTIQFSVTDQEIRAPISIDSFTLTPNGGDSSYANIQDDFIVNIHEIGTAEFNFRANSTPSNDFGSVVFVLGGEISHNRTENGYTWDMPASSIPGDEYVVGYYTLTATPYDDGGGEGLAGTPLTVNFFVIDSDYDGWETANSLPADSESIDTDLDGIDNYFEWLADADPNDPLDKGANPRVSVVSSDIAFEWTVAAGRILGGDYLLEYTTDLSSWTSLFELDPAEYALEDNTTAGMTSYSLTLTDENVAKAFIRLSKP